MRMSQEEKEKSHARIVANASRLVRERGLEGASVGEVMKAAGMTHGGFYKHFESKEVLIEAAIDAAFAGFVEALDRGEPEQAVAAYRALYLSEDHKNQPGLGCPVATVGQEIGRAPDGLKAAFGRGVRHIVAALARVRIRSSQGGRRLPRVQHARRRDGDRACERSRNRARRARRLQKEIRTCPVTSLPRRTTSLLKLTMWPVRNGRHGGAGSGMNLRRSMRL